jgi:hypothetical protein
MSVAWGKERLQEEETTLPPNMDVYLNSAQSYQEMRRSARFVYASVAVFLLVVVMLVVWLSKT